MRSARAYLPKPRNTSGGVGLTRRPPARGPGCSCCSTPARAVPPGAGLGLHRRLGRERGQVARLQARGRDLLRRRRPPGRRRARAQARTSRADGLVGAAEGPAGADQVVGQVGRGQEPTRAGGGHPAHPRNARARDHAGHRRQEQLDRVDGVEQVDLVLLQVLVVRERQAGEHAEQPGQVGERGAAPWPRASSAASGFFFCGSIDEPELKASSSSTKPTSSLGPPARSRRRGARGARRAGRRSGGSRRGRRGCRRASRLLGRGPRRSRAPRAVIARSIGKPTPASAPAAERALLAGRRTRGPGGPAVAREHPDVGQQVVGQAHGLRALQVGVAGQQRVEVRPRPERQQRLGQRPAAPRPARRRGRADVEQRVGGDLVVAAAGGVQAPAGVADQLGEAALHRRVDVLVAGERRRSCSRRAPPPPAPGPRRSRRRPRAGMIPQAPSMRAWAREPATSSGQRRRSTASEAFRRSNASAGPAAKRPPQSRPPLIRPRCRPAAPALRRAAERAARPGRPGPRSSRGRTAARSWRR